MHMHLLNESGPSLSWTQDLGHLRVSLLHSGFPRASLSYDVEFSLLGTYSNEYHSHKLSYVFFGLFFCVASWRF